MSKGSINNHIEDAKYSIDIETVDGETKSQDVWCVDATEDLSGEVGVYRNCG